MKTVISEHSQTDEVLHSTEFLELRVIKKPADGIDGYVYSHEKRCDGKIIVTLPFRTVGSKTEYLLRNEVTPCWGLKSEISSITGGFEPEKGIEGTAVLEIEEEAGYEVAEKDLINLGTVRGTKSSDTVYHLFAVDLTDVKKTTEAKGDGSVLESKASCEWSESLNECQDPFAYVAYVRLEEHLSRQDHD